MHPGSLLRHSRLVDICELATGCHRYWVTLQLQSLQPLLTSCHRASAASTRAPLGRRNLDIPLPLSVSVRWLQLAGGGRAVRGRGLAEPPKVPVGGPLVARALGGVPELPMSALRQGAAGCGRGEEGAAVVKAFE